MKNQHFVVVLGFFLSCATMCHACLWDYDTLEMERQHFPSAHELVVGKFVRHSPAYYKWRIADRTAKSPETQTAADFDDIAVAYDKLGQHDKAIETVTARMDRWPEERQYEAHANLGTFHIHAGRYEQGLVHITKAIELNPDAHFGREVYQKHLVEFMITQQPDYVPESSDDNVWSSFWDYVVLEQTEKLPPGTADWGDETAKAVKGVLGMMRFGNYDSPVLLEALGDLLSGGHQSNSNMLAARAYLRAAETRDAERLREKAEEALTMQVGVNIADIESDLKREVEEGTKFYEQIARDEQQWVAAGKNLDEEFANRYYGTKPQVEIRLVDRITVGSRITFGVVISLAGIALGIFILARAAMQRMFRPAAEH